MATTPVGLFLSEWLATLGLGDYLALLASRGVSTMSDCSRLSDTDLVWSFLVVADSPGFHADAAGT